VYLTSALSPVELHFSLKKCSNENFQTWSVLTRLVLEKTLRIKPENGFVFKTVLFAFLFA